MANQGSKPVLYIVINNHFDLTWRRCWQRPFEYKGQTYISYLDIETYYMLDNLALAEQNRILQIRGGKRPGGTQIPRTLPGKSWPICSACSVKADLQSPAAVKQSSMPT
jgi:hypothetical protein